MKNIIILSVLLFVLTSFIQSEQLENDKIEWSSKRKLEWGDFRGKPPMDFSLKKAETTVNIENISVDYYHGTKIPKYVIRCYFYPNQSWSLTSDDTGLIHEQLHFDIGELYTRKIRKKFKELNLNKIEEESIYIKAFNDYFDECIEVNDNYDRQVYKEVFGNVVFNEEMQEQWCSSIASQLEELKEYEYKGTDIGNVPE